MSTKFKIILSISIFITLMVLIYLYAMFIGTRGFIVKEYGIRNTKITESYHGFKIAHISDIHYQFSMRKRDLERVVEDINRLKPDIVVMTGDLLDPRDITDKEHEELVEVLSRLNPRIGKYAVDGNHDCQYKKLGDLLEEAGFINLNDTYDLIYDNSNRPIFIAGISDSKCSVKTITERSTAIFDYINSEENDSIYSILLIHKPDYIELIDYRKFDLILAGHSHNGQVRLPFFGAIVRLDGAKKYFREHYQLGNTDLYISSGLGESFLPIRLFNRRSYNFYRLLSR